MDYGLVITFGGFIITIGTLVFYAGSAKRTHEGYDATIKEQGAEITILSSEIKQHENELNRYKYKVLEEFMLKKDFHAYEKKMDSRFDKLDASFENVLRLLGNRRSDITEG